ncbi:MAG: SH3 domain-containing protein [Proteobacteria bacterium]|nr:SH3 domain-containing protein [Pseudomonadota bacterium]
MSEYMEKKDNLAIGGSQPAAASLQAASSTQTGRVTASVLNVRTGPGTNHSVATTLKNGATVTITGTSNGWHTINLNGAVRYVSAQYVSITGGSAPAQQPSGGGGTTQTALLSQAKLTAARSWYAGRYPESFIKDIQRVVGIAQTGTLNDAAYEAIAVWQKGKSLVVDGMFGKASAAKAGLSLPSSSSGSGGGSTTVVPTGTPGKGGIEQLTTKQVAALQSGRSSRVVTDLATGKKFNASWAASPGYHTDWTPMATADTDVCKSLLNRGSGVNWNSTSAWSWDARMGHVNIDGRIIACGFHLRPHGSLMGGSPGAPLKNQSNTRPSSGWPIGGHMCMYYGDSPGGTQSCNTAAKNAYNNGA